MNNFNIIQVPIFSPWLEKIIKESNYLTLYWLFFNFRACAVNNENKIIEDTIGVTPTNDVSDNSSAKINGKSRLQRNDKVSFSYFTLPQGVTQICYACTPFWHINFFYAILVFTLLFYCLKCRIFPEIRTVHAVQKRNTKLVVVQPLGDNLLS